MDSFTYSHLVDSDEIITNSATTNGDNAPDVSVSGPIEYSGTDFWRESNHEILDLRDGDIFFTRIAVFVRKPLVSAESQSQTLNRLAATLNIDDISTHFGCSLATDWNSLERMQDIKAKLAGSFSITDCVMHKKLSSDLMNPYNQRRRPRLASFAVQFEPYRLIICVFVVLASIMGVIAVIVFVVVPYVEQIAINYHDQLTRGLSSIDSTPRNSNENLAETCELTTESDWEQVSRYWRRSRVHEITLMDSEMSSGSSSSSTRRPLSSVYVISSNEDDIVCSQDLNSPKS